MKRVQECIKRLFDIAVVVLALPFATVATIWAAWRVQKYFPGRPIILRQERIGLHEKHFYLFKLRTLPTDYRPGIDQVTDLPLELVRLRRWSLDELPQLLNVLRGEMSIIGPGRPLEPIEHYIRYAGASLLLSAARPSLISKYAIDIHKNGSTDLPVNPSQVAYDAQAIELGTEYISEWSLRDDIKILASYLKLAGRYRSEMIETFRQRKAHR